MRIFSPKEKKEGKRFGPVGVAIKHSGPINLAEFDCHACPGPSTLNDENCRACVFGRLGVEGDLDQIILRRACCRVYRTHEISKIAKTLAALKQLALDRTMYTSSETKECLKCANGRMHELVDEIWDKLLANPHDPKPLEELAQNTAGPKESAPSARGSISSSFWSPSKKG